jgi:ribosomal protein S18 acetylase RimI-like enzyme
MLSVVHTLSEDVVGFCELAWLPCPRPNLIEVTTQQSYAPAIVNLVISSTYRRKGIASRLLKFASKYTTTQWKRTQYDNDSTRLGLYVQLENESALRLYRKEGFTHISNNSDVDGLIYMRQK